MHETNGDPQFTTQGVYRQADDVSPGPMEGQGGVRLDVPPTRPRQGRKSLAARRGKDETRRKTGLGKKAKNAGQLRNPKERKARQMGPTGRARAGIGKRPRGKKGTAATLRAKGSPKAARRKGNRGTR